MCGIVGFLRHKQNELECRETVSGMSKALIHRGPDDEGLFIDDYIALGHRRLSIIDLKTGHQPITNEDGSLIIVFNGEIYNYKELKSRLQARGHRFSTNTDTETIIHLYEDLGKDCVKELNGIFAFALWDKKLKKLVLARDRIGVKPLHYCNLHSHFFFGSEIKSLLEYPYVNKEIDAVSLSKYLVYEFVPAPNSIYKHIKKLLPAHTLEYDLNTCSLKTEMYWHADFVHKFKNISETEAAERLLATLRGVVAKELLSDVPIGLFLSGGIDSSTLAFLMAEIGEVNSFCIGFEDKTFDESKYARQVAKHLGIKHREEIFGSRDLINSIPDIIEFLDEPLADPSIVPTYFLSRFARRHITVALGGDGGDELFAGYDTYQAHRIASYFKYVPEIIKKGVNKFIDYLPVSTANMSLDFKLKKFKSGINYNPEIRNSIWLGAFKDTDLDGLLLDGNLARDRVFEDITYLNSAMQGIEDEIERMQYLDLRFYLQDDILVKVDRASMANSLEVRVPFLNHELVDFMTRLPAKMKLKGITSKFILKKAIKNKLPAGILGRRKKGFGLPVARWIKNELHDLILETLNPTRLKEEGIFNVGYVNKLLSEHFKGLKDNRKKIWTIFIFELWLKK